MNRNRIEEIPDDSSPSSTQGPAGIPLFDFAAGLGGGVVGAILGMVLFELLTRQGFYALVLPGAFTGLGCGSLSRHRSVSLGLICGLIGVLSGVVTEWRFAPFSTDPSFTYFLTHLFDLKPFTLFLIALGGFLAFWFGMGRRRGAWLRRQPASARD